MDDTDLPDDFKDVEIIYSDDEDVIEEMIDDEFIEDDFNDEDIQVIDLAKLTFIKHTKSVFSSDLSKDKQLAVTGGEDDSAYVWSTNTGEIHLECTGHKDSVTEVRFNHDSQLIATGDMAGMIQVWNIKDKKLIWCDEGDDMEWLLWHPIVNVLISGSHSGNVYIWQIPQGNCKVLASNGSPCTCGEILPDGKRLITGYTDGQIKLWDIKTSSVIWQLSEPQDIAITSLRLNSDGSLVSVAPSSDIIKIADGKILKKFMLDGETEIETTLFISELGVLVTGSLSGQLCVWDISRHTLRHQARIECAVTVMKKGPNGKIFIGATDGAIYVCDVKTGTLLETLTGHKSEILSISVPDDDGSVILSTSDDGTAKIFNITS